jgi:hypothetical protein
VLNERFGVDAGVILTLLWFVVFPGLVGLGVCWLVVKVRQLLDVVADIYWRMGGPAPPQRGVVTPFRRRSG